MNVFTKLKVFKATRLTRQAQLKKSIGLLRSMFNSSAIITQKWKDLSVLTQDSIQPTIKKSQPKSASKMQFKKINSEISKFNTQKQGARFEEHSFSNAAGKRNYKLYIPSNYAGKKVPLVVMMHGCTQSPDDFALGTQMNMLAEEMNFIVAYPAQIKSANASKCWNWFNTKDQKRDKGEPSIIAGITEKIIESFVIDKKRIYIAGLSAGGAAAAIMGAEYPDLYTAVGVHSGLASGAANNIITAMNAMRQGSMALKTNDAGKLVPVIVFHGDNDNTVASINGQQVIGQFKGKKDLKSVVKKAVSDGGIKYTLTTHSDNNITFEHWVLHGVGHAWSGGSIKGSYTDPIGPNASREMIRFFLSHSK